MSDIAIDPPIRKAFEKYKNPKGTSNEERLLLFGWISQMLAKDPTFDIQQLARDEFGYEPAECLRLDKGIKHFISRDINMAKDQLVKSAISKEESKFFDEFGARWAAEMTGIAKEIVMQAAQSAKEMGYYNQDKHFVDIKRYVEDALKYFAQNKDTINNMVQERDHYKALSESFYEQMQPRVEHEELYRMYLWFISQMQALQARGYRVPASIVQEAQNLMDETYNRLVIMSREMVNEGIER